MTTPVPVLEKGGGDKSDKPSDGDNVFKAPDCCVKKVTVYADRAEVCRSLETRVKKGVNEVILRNLPSVIDEDSIRVEGTGQATIMEVFFRTKHVTQDKEQGGAEEKELRQRVKELQEKKEEISTRLNIIKKQWEILDRFSESATKPPQSQETEVGPPLGDGYFQGVKGFLGLYGTEAGRLETSRLATQRELESIDQKLTAVQKNLAEICNQRLEAVTDFRECTVVLEAEGETTVTLVVSYVVSEASWMPSYDIRMYTSDGKMKIQYYGQIRQTTGEDWPDAKLFLSTAKPSIGGSVPTLATLQLSIRRYRPVRTQSARFRTLALEQCDEMELADEDMMMHAGLMEGGAAPVSVKSRQKRQQAKAKPPRLAVAGMQVMESTTSTTYEIARASTIPSDNSEHKVTVGIIDVSPTLEYVTVPKMAPHAFLQAHVKNNSPFALLPGPTSIFLDNAFVARAELNAVAPQEEFECSLGVDPSVRVTYRPLKKYTSTTGLIAKSSVTTHEQVTEVKNLHDYKVKITVRDQLPRSSEDKVKVQLLEPTVDLKHPEKTPGVRLTKANHLEWELELEAQKSRQLMAKYTVELPSGEELTSTETFSSTSI